MKTKIHILLAILLAALATFHARAQGTAFTYQGRLSDNGAPATGHYDMLFSLYDAASGGTQVDGTLMGSAVPVTNGLFTISLDFGSGIFTGPARWLKIDVRTNGSAAPYTPLSPRQALTATPYAITAGNLTGVVSSGGFAGTYANAVTLNNAANQFTGVFAGNGTSVSNVNALTLGGLGAANFWKTGGNAGTTPGAHFVGTTDNQPLEFKVNNARALRLEPNTNGAPNVIGGSPRNFVGAGVVGATIGGGGATNLSGSSFTNRVLGSFGVVSGGRGNTIAQGADSTIGGGGNNSVASSAATIAGGVGNTISNSTYATIAGGHGHFIGTNSIQSTIGGGGEHVIKDAERCTIAGGFINYIAQGESSGSSSCSIGGGSGNIIIGSLAATIAGGNLNVIWPASGSSIGGGFENYIGTNASGSAIAGGQGNFIADGPDNLGHWSTIAGGYNNIIGKDSFFVAIGGGQQNEIGTNSPHGTISGGEINRIDALSSHATIAGGSGNFIGTNSSVSTIGGGTVNFIQNAFRTTIGGGWGNNVIGYSQNIAHGTIGGGVGNEIIDASSATIAGGHFIVIDAGAAASSVGGGFANSIAGSAEGATIAGGEYQSIGSNGAFATIAGGYQNSIGTNSWYTTIGGGGVNSIASVAQSSTIPGGYGNFIGRDSVASTIGGGFENSIGTSSSSSLIGGGIGNVITDNAENATIPGGYSNSATNSAFAAGTRAKAIHPGAFVWGDSTPADMASTNANSWTVRASGGVRFFSNTNATAGVSLAPGGTAWAVISDRSAKKDFIHVNSRAVLEKLSAIPITQWRYRWENENTTPHIGPMAQDFKAAFYPGSDDKSITTQEADGVALAAIQGLNAKLEEKLQQQETEIAELRQAVKELKGLVNQLTATQRRGVQ